MFLCLLLYKAGYMQTLFPTALMDSLSVKAQSQLNGKTAVYAPNESRTVTLQSSPAAAFKLQNRLKKITLEKLCASGSKSTDTLFVGLTAGDSLHITGSFINNGPVVVVGDGVLVFENAQALIYGDIIVWGQDAHLIISNSYITCPQAYIYQRSMIAADRGCIDIENSTLDYSGMSHNLSVNDSAVVNWVNVTKYGFTTCGLWGYGEVHINGTPQAGEFIMSHHARASFVHANTVLIWHHIPDTATFNLSFPAGDTLPLYHFSDTLPGVDGIYYSYTVDSCTDVMWGLMPEPGSQTQISNSEIRTIGLWFKNQTGFQVSGLVNNSQYAGFTAPLSDRSLVLTNTFVRTWSLYVFENAQGQVDNCITGEIGVFNNGDVEVNNTLTDGSGGYVFAENTSKMIYGFSYLNCDFQSKDNAFAFLAYGGQNWGRSIALDKSIMFIIQANLTDLPEMYNDAMVWYVKLEGSASLSANAVNTIQGSVWLDKASNFYPHEFSHYVLDYRHPDSTVWQPVCGPVFNEVYSNVLCSWNTTGIIPGTYLLRLRMWDNTPDSNMVEALRLYNIQLLTDSKERENENGGVEIYPNPASTVLNIIGDNVSEAVISVFDLHSNSINLTPLITRSGLKVDVSSLKSGVYFVRFETRDKLFIKRVVIIK